LLALAFEAFNQLDTAHAGHQNIDQKASFAAWTIGFEEGLHHNWRLMALGSLVLSLVLAAILLWIGRSGSTTPYMVEVDPRGGARAIGPAAEVYKPSDAQIAFHLARFVDNVRSLSIDPVVVRQNWLKAYDFITDRAAVTLNEYARDNDPFAKVGRETIAVEVTSVVRASDSSFQVRWLERSFEAGALKDTKWLTGLFSIVITPPRTVEAVRKNPLGIYVHTFNWSQDVNRGESK
jgi:type IV secretory pathway TrbF-like protein